MKCKYCFGELYNGVCVSCHRRDEVVINKIDEIDIMSGIPSAIVKMRHTIEEKLSRGMSLLDTPFVYQGCHIETKEYIWKDIDGDAFRSQIHGEGIYVVGLSTHGIMVDFTIGDGGALVVIFINSEYDKILLLALGDEGDNYYSGVLTVKLEHTNIEAAMERVLRYVS